MSKRDPSEPLLPGFTDDDLMARVEYLVDESRDPTEPSTTLRVIRRVAREAEVAGQQEQRLSELLRLGRCEDLMREVRSELKNIRAEVLRVGR